jgi:hypothetical protein
MLDLGRLGAGRGLGLFCFNVDILVILGRHIFLSELDDCLSKTDFIVQT